MPKKLKFYVLSVEIFVIIRRLKKCKTLLNNLKLSDNLTKKRIVNISGQYQKLTEKLKFCLKNYISLFPLSREETQP